MKETLKDIEKLTSGLYQGQDASKVAGELFEADGFAARLEMVTPSDTLIASIKADVASELSAKRNSNNWMVRAIAMAACVVFAYTLTTKIYLQSDSPPVQIVSQPSVAAVDATAVKADTFVAMVWDDDDQVSVLSTRLQNIETAFYQADDSYYEAEFSVADIEMQISDLQGLFWKG